MVVESWIMGKLLDFNHQGLTLRFMEAAKKDKVDSAAVDMTLTHSNRELLERKSQSFFIKNCFTIMFRPGHIF